MENTGWVMPTHIIAGAGIVINEKDEVLMVKTHNAGWVFPGGQVEVGENVIDAVKREILEEAGIEIAGIVFGSRERHGVCHALPIVSPEGLWTVCPYLPPRCHISRPKWNNIPKPSTAHLYENGF